ncbi:MAG: Rpn family recombination-promoting nuclease/putative transposase [Bacteroides sp.]|nr:Rpn family recombination-promoting nuclease/putative transposase [Bacteroides sp.]
MSELTSVFINPLTDFGFKYLFGEEANKKFILSFLNSLLTDGKVITDVEFVDKERISDSKSGRVLIYDLHCKTSDGEKIIVEMQNRTQTYFDDRALFYLAGDIYHQGRKGKNWDYRLTPVYGVFLMNFEWKENMVQEIRDDVGLVNLRTLKLFSNKLRMTFLKIPMMNKSPEECKSTLDRWLYLFKNMENMNTMPKAFMNDPVFRELNDVAQVAALPVKKRKNYERSLKAYRDWYSIIETERAEGIVEGERKMLNANVARMRSNGFSDKDIAKILDQPLDLILSI